MGRLGKAICAAGLAALLCGPIAAQEPQTRTYTTSRPKTQLDDIMGRIFVVGWDAATPKGEKISFVGTAFLYLRDAQFNYYITNDHVVTAMVESILAPEPMRMNAPEYLFYRNGVDWQVQDKGKLIYADPISDYAIIVSPNKGQPPLAPVVLELEGLDLGERVYMFGMPLATLPTLYIGHVAGFDIASIDGTQPIPGYRLHITALPGNSGSVVFVERDGEYRWAALVHAANLEVMTAQTVPVRTFYEKLLELSGDGAGGAPAQSPTGP